MSASWLLQCNIYICQACMLIVLLVCLQDGVFQGHNTSQESDSSRIFSEVSYCSTCISTDAHMISYVFSSVGFVPFKG